MPQPPAYGNTGLPAVDRQNRRPVVHPQTSPDGGGGLSLQSAFRALLRRRWSLIIPLLLFPLAAVIAIARIAPSYEATSEVLIEANQINLGNLTGVLGNLNPDLDALSSEVKVVTSRKLAGQVVDNLDLTNNPSFYVAKSEGPGSFERAIDAVGGATTAAIDWAVATVGGVTGAEPASPNPSPSVLPSETVVPEERIAAVKRDEVIDVLLGRLDVEVLGASRVMMVTYTGPSPEEAAIVANAVADAYLDERVQVKLDAVDRANDWINQRLLTLQDSVQDAEQRAESFRAQAGITSGVDADLVTEQISRLSGQLTDARSDLIRAQSTLNQARAALANPNAADSVPEIQGSQIIVRLRDQEAQIRSEYAELSAELGRQHPRMIEMRAQLSQIEEGIATEVRRVVASLQRGVQAARSRVASLEASLDDLRGQTQVRDTASIELRDLERRAAAERDHLTAMLVESQRLTTQFDVTQPDARILSPAVVPAHPSSPKKKLILAGAILLALTVGLLLIYLQELLDQACYSSDDIDDALGVRTLALVPEVRTRRRLVTASMPLTDPLSRFTDAMQSLSLMVRSRGDVANSLAVVSARPAEGKSTVAAALARTAALHGERVILIDCDLRRPSLTEVFSGGPTPGLSDILRGRNTADMAIRRDPHSPLSYIPAGAPRDVAYSTSLLQSEAMTNLLDELRQEFDLIVMDAPPLMATVDSVIVAEQAGTALLCVRWQETPKRVASQALKKLDEAGIEVLGAVLSRVDTRRLTQYGYADSEYYNPRYNAYHGRS
ncbi:MAG: GumC family protein [Geminicoccaceae bacterium]